MKIRNKIENGVLRINATAYPVDIHPIYLEGLDGYVRKDVKRQMSAICRANGLSYEPSKDLLVQLAFKSDDLNCPNMRTKVFIVEDENGLKHNCKLETAYFPKKLLTADRLDIMYPASIKSFNYTTKTMDNILSFYIRMNLTIDRNGGK